MRRQGSVTVFFSLVLLLLSSLFFSMVESVRVYEMRLESRVITQAALSNALSEYQRYLWDTYGILAVDCGYGRQVEDASLLENRLLDYAYENCQVEDGVNLFYPNPTEVEAISYGLLTDDDGAALIRQGALTAQRQITQEALTSWRDAAGECEDVSVDAPDVETLVDEAERAMEEAQEAEEAQDTEDAWSSEEKQTPATEGAHEVGFIASSEQTREVHTVTYMESSENPLEVFAEIQREGLLGLLTGSKEISDKAIDLSDSLLKRDCMQGNYANMEASLSDRMFFEWYVLASDSYCGGEKEGRALTYEVEYLIAGQESDRENLEQTALRLLAIREVQNGITIATSPDMMRQAYELATVIAGATVNPLIIQAVQAAIVAVWALVESILDVRTLLDGGKVSFLKNASQWKSSLGHLAAALGEEVLHEEEETGLSYAQYLTAMITALPQRTLAYRCMDLMEGSLRAQEDYTQSRMDQMVYAIEVDISYQGNALFDSYIGADVVWGDFYQCSAIEQISYL